jgi:hypothetical protein
MKQFRTLGVALMAIFAISLIASATALAENPEILPVPTKEKPLKFTTEGLDKEYILDSTKKTVTNMQKFHNKRGIHLPGFRNHNDGF